VIFKETKVFAYKIFSEELHFYLMKKFFFNFKLILVLKRNY